MTAATSDVTTPVADTATAPTTGTTPADASGTAGTATLAAQDQTAAAAHAARRARKLDAFGFGLLGFGLVVFLGLFGVDRLRQLGLLPGRPDLGQHHPLITPGQVTA